VAGHCSAFLFGGREQVAMAIGDGTPGGSATASTSGAGKRASSACATVTRASAADRRRMSTHPSHAEVEARMRAQIEDD
jgi:hypothetical protein